MYQPRQGSKRYKALEKLAGVKGMTCIHCGKFLMHPQSIINHVGPKCLENKAKKPHTMNDKHPTVEEQARAYAKKKWDAGFFSSWHEIAKDYLAGHASRDKEIEGLKERIKELEGRNKAILNTNGQLGSQC